MDDEARDSDTYPSNTSSLINRRYENMLTITMNLDLQNNNNFDTGISHFDGGDFSELSLSLLNSTQELFMAAIADEMDSLNINSYIRNNRNNLNNERFRTEFNQNITDGIREKIRRVLERFVFNIHFSINLNIEENLRTQNIKILSSLKKQYGNHIRKIRGTKKFLKETNQDVTNNPVCPICLDVLKYQRIWHVSKNCNHIAHPTCLRNYYNYIIESQFKNNEEYNIKCPVCRKIIIDSGDLNIE